MHANAAAVCACISVRVRVCVHVCTIISARVRACVRAGMRAFAEGLVVAMEQIRCQQPCGREADRRADLLAQT